MRNAFVETLTANKDVFVITGDNGAGLFDDFKKNHPDRFLNMGIAEQNIASFSAGLSLSGYRVCMFNIIPFLLYRAYEQIRNDICYQKVPIILAGIGSGITYAPQGMTHYAVEDIGIAQTLPNLTIISPADQMEARASAEYALEANFPVYVRMSKKGEPGIHVSKVKDLSVPQVIKEGKDVAVVFHGSISAEVMIAYHRLVELGIHPTIISIPLIQPLDVVELFCCLRSVKIVISVEEHYEHCGLGSILRQVFHMNRAPWRLRVMGIPFGFIHTIKDTSNMRKHFGISAQDIVNAVRQEIGVKHRVESLAERSRTPFNESL